MITAENAKKITDKALSKKIVNHVMDEIEKQIIECSQEGVNLTMYIFDSICSTTELDHIITGLRKYGYYVNPILKIPCCSDSIEGIEISW